MKYVILLVMFSFELLGQSKLDQATKKFDDKKYEEAEKLLKPIAEGDRDYATAQFYLGRIAYLNKNYEDASDYLEEAIDTKDNVAEYYSWLGDTYAAIAQDANPIKQGLLAPKMRSAWEKAISLDSKNLPARVSLIQFYLQAPGIMGGSVDKAKEMATQVQKIKPAEGHRQLGNIYLNEKNVIEAEKEYKLMVKADPAFAGVLANFYVNQKQWDKAFQLFDDAIQKNPNDFLAIYQIGKTSALSGQKLDRGEECLKKYLTHTPQGNEPSHAGANMRLAQIHEKKGNKKEAKRLYQLAINSDPNLKEAKEGLDRMSK